MNDTTPSARTGISTAMAKTRNIACLAPLMNPPMQSTTGHGSCRSYRSLKALLALAALLAASPAFAGSATWDTTPGTAIWNTNTNWTPNTGYPNGVNDVATFGASSVTGVSITANTQVNSIVFTSALSSNYTITVGTTFTLNVSGTGITNNSAVIQTFVTAVDGAGNAGTITFSGAATAGTTTTFNNNAATATGGAGGSTVFNGSSTAGSAVFINGGSTVINGAGGSTIFNNNSSAGNAIITNYAGTVADGFGGSTTFTGNSSAGNATITTNGAPTSIAIVPKTLFMNSATADNATFVVNAGTANGGLGGLLEFTNASTAGNGNFTVNGATFAGATGGVIQLAELATAGNGVFNVGAGSVANGGSQIQFFVGATAGNAYFNVLGASVSGGQGGFVTFASGTTAGNGSFTVVGGSVAGAPGGSVTFNSTATAGSATLIANGGTSGGAGGLIQFSGSSTGGAAIVKVYGNGALDISNDVQGVTIGSLEGTGIVSLGANNLTLGGNNLSTTFSGVIQDAGMGGSITKIGSGTLTLTGANTYTGGTSITGGLINFNSLGNFGTGSVAINGGGLQWAAGAATDISGRLAAIGTGGATFDTNGNNVTFGSPLSGPGGVTKAGAGTLTFNAANTYTGATIVSQGSLLVNGSIASANTTVLPGALLGGSGTVGGNLASQGTVSPGDAPGTLTVNRNFSQSSNGTLLIQIAGLAPAQHDLLTIAGSASLAGTLQLQSVNGFQLRPGEEINFLTAGGGISGRFATVIDPFTTGPLVGVNIVYFSNSIVLDAEQIPLTAIPRETPNQRVVANAIDASFSDPRNAALIARLDNEPLDKVLNDLDRIAPAELTSIYQVAISQAKVQTANLQRRLEDVRSGSNGFSAAGLAMNGGAPPQTGSYEVSGPPGPDGKEGKAVFTPAPDNRWGVFVTGTGEWASAGDTSNARGYDLTNAGFTLGIDYKLTDHLIIGLATGYDHSSVDLPNNGRVIVDGGKLALYSSYFTGQGFYTDLAVQGGYNGYDTHRAAIAGLANGSDNGGELNVLFGTGYDWKVGGLTFGPTGNFEYTYLGLDRFGENGSLAPLDFPGQHQESIRSTFGAKVGYDWKLGSVLLKPELRAGWQHEYGDATLGIDSSFANGAGPEFLVHGPATGRDSLLLSAGIAIQCSERCSTYVYYDGELGRTNYQANSVSGGFRFAF